MNAKAQRTLMKKIALLLITLSASLFASSLIEVESKYGVNKTVANIKAAIASKKGVSVFNIVDHKRNAQSVGLNMPQTQLVVFGNPNAGTALMKINPLMAYELPMKILVSHKNGKTYMTYRDPSWLSKTYHLEKSPIIGKMTKMMKFLTSSSK